MCYTYATNVDKDVSIVIGSYLNANWPAVTVEMGYLGNLTGLHTLNLTTFSKNKIRTYYNIVFYYFYCFYDRSFATIGYVSLINEQLSIN